ncbi:MAG: sugar phosphate nucleotidyltransferase [Candidatus Nanoarchaeia archaeon]
MKTRFSITMDEDILKNLDSLVDGKHIRSRSEAIETIIRRFLEANKVAVFLAGGDPEKLKINNVFRPLVKILEKPLILYSIEQLRSAGFKTIYIIGQNKMVGELFKELGNGEKFGVKINYVEEDESLGEFKTLQRIEKDVKSPFLMLQIDNYFNFDLNELFKAFAFNKGALTLAVQARSEIEERKGVLEMLGNQITNFEETPVNIKSTLASTTIGICDPSIFDYIPNGNIRYTKNELFPCLIKDKQMNGFIIKGPWFNVHEMSDVRLLEKHLKSNKKNGILPVVAAKA